MRLAMLVVLAMPAALAVACSSSGADARPGAICSSGDAGSGAGASASGPTSCLSTSAAACPDVYALVAASTTYQSSGLGVLATTACETSFASGLDLGGDPALASSGGHSFWVDRGNGGHIFPLDACGAPHGRMDLSPDATVLLDPQDVAVDARCNLWIPYYGVPRLEERAADGTVLATLDLSSYDTDGNPNASSASLVTTSRGEEVFVTLENLDVEQPYPQPEAFSQMLVVDVATASVSTVVKLAGTNPFGLTKGAGAHLYLAEPGSFSVIGEAAAGVERFDPESRQGTLVATERALGGSVVEVAVADDETCAVAILADPSMVNRTSLVAFDLASGQVTQRLLAETSGFDLQGVSWVRAGSRLLVGDRSGEGPYAVHSFVRGAGCALTEEPDALFLPQAPLAFHAVSH